jgi:hypothetical protein
MASAVATTDSFVRDTSSAFTRAFAAAPPAERREASLHLAGRVIRVRIAGAALARCLTPALAHLDGPDASNVDLTIRCWDGHATGIGPPPRPWALDDFLPSGGIRGHANDRIRIAYNAGTRTLGVFDHDAAEAYVYVADAANVPEWVRRAPLRNILTWWANDRVLPLLHAAAVGDGAGAVALAGGRGAGKSTTAMACVAAGFGFLADDACLVRLDPDPTVFAVYAFAKLEPHALARLPALRRDRVGAGSAADQCVLAPRELVSSAALRSVLIPYITGERRTRVVPVAAREALRSLVASTLIEADGAGITSLHAITRLVHDVPCARLELGTDLSGVVDAVRRVLGTV